MDSILALPDADLSHGGTYGEAFRAVGAASFRDACRWVRDRPYGSNVKPDEAMALVRDGRGTCFGKHGAIAHLAVELDLDVHNNLGFYRLTDDIVTGAADVLRPAGLTFVPAVHCFLDHRGTRIDLTEGNLTGRNQRLDQFDFVVRVPPGTTRDDVRRHYSDIFPQYCAIDPRLGALGEEAVRLLMQQCQRLAASRCLALAGPPATGTS